MAYLSKWLAYSNTVQLRVCHFLVCRICRWSTLPVAGNPCDGLQRLDELQDLPGKAQDDVGSEGGDAPSLEFALPLL